MKDTLSVKQEIVFRIIKTAGEISQGDIVEEMLRLGYYQTNEGKSNIKSARPCVSKLVNQLKNKKIIYVSRTEKNIDAGKIDKNFWRVRE